MISRRQFLNRSKNLIVLSALAELFPGLSFGDEVATPSGAEDHFFVTLQTMGGMDVTLGLDPWEMPRGMDAEDLFLEYRPDEIIQAEGLRLGPAAAPLKDHAKDSLIVNGIMMRRDAGHDVINQYMLTGRGDGKAASLAAELGIALGTGPFGLVMDSPVYLAGKPLAVAMAGDILAEADQGKLIEAIEEQIKVFAAGKGTPFELAEKSVVEGKDAALRLLRILTKLKEEFGKLEAYHVAAATFAAGASRQAQLYLAASGIGLDTHGSHETNHLNAQREIWQRTADIFSVFKKIPYKQGSLFDATTFFVMSEWSRTPALNAAKGKDHNPFTNSCLLAGKGIRGGTVVGASRMISRSQTTTGYSDHIAWPFDYRTGKLADGPQGASFFFPENIVRTIGHVFGNPPAFTPVAETVPIIPGIAR